MMHNAAPAGLAADADIENCYRLLLGREPDPSGFAHWKKAVRAQRITSKQLVCMFLDCQEFRGKSVRTSVQWGHSFTMPGSESMYPEDGRYEPYVYQPLMAALQPGCTFLDVGANIGVFSVLAAAKGARVISIEPQQTNCRFILMNARNNGVEVLLHPLAVSDEPGYAQMGTSSATTNAAISTDLDMMTAEVVALNTLDNLVQTKVDVLKIDVEGFEHKALKGGRTLLEKFHPILFTEYSPEFQKHAGSSGVSYLDFLLSFGYRITVLHRYEQAEEVRSPDDVERCWKAAMQRGITHLDLMLH